jgi:hypothetical protein
MVTHPAKRIAVLVLIVIQIGASILIPFSHQHVLCDRSNGTMNIQSHDCGVKEIHKPLDDACHCLLCLRDSSSYATPACSFVAPRSCALAITENTAALVPLEAYSYSEPDRGPPELSA